MQSHSYNLPIKEIRLKSLTCKLLLFQCTSSVKEEIRMVSQLKGGKNTEDSQKSSIVKQWTESRELVTSDYA